MRTLDLSENEREALRQAIYQLGWRAGGRDARLALMSMLERSVPRRLDVRYVVKCRSRYGTKWEKVFFEKHAAQVYARDACSKWCNRESVRITKQKWIPF